MQSNTKRVPLSLTELPYTFIVCPKIFVGLSLDASPLEVLNATVCTPLIYDQKQNMQKSAIHLAGVHCRVYGHVFTLFLRTEALSVPCSAFELWPNFFFQFGKHALMRVAVICTHRFVLKVNTYFRKEAIGVASPYHNLSNLCIINTAAGAEDINSTGFPLLPRGD